MGLTSEEFTNFGQHYRFSLIPDSEFWIDREDSPDESDIFVEHRLVEHRLIRSVIEITAAFV